MADPVKETTGKASGFITRKIGPLPMWAWLAIGIGLYLWYQHQHAAAAAATATNQQTDPAGNVGSIDPATGYVYGTPEDLAALAADNPGTGDSGSAGQGGTPGAQTYADNNAWGIAAINYLAALGVDASTANQAIELYLSSQPLTSAQQADVNLAIGALGPPPSLPGPTSGNPPPVTNPPPGGGGGGTAQVTVPKVTGLTATAAVTALHAAGLVAGSEGKNGGTAKVNSQTPGAGKKVARGSTVDLGLAAAGGGGGTPPPKPKSVPAPTGLVVTAKHSTSASIKWNRVTGATGYQVAATDMASKKAVNQRAGAGSTTATIGGLTPSHSYVFDVWAEPTASGQSGTGPHAEVSATLPRTG